MMDKIASLLPDWSEMKRLCHPHYLISIILATFYFPIRSTRPICELMFPEAGCELDYRETEILFFLVVVILFRTRKMGISSLVPYLASAAMYTKVAMCLLFFYHDFRYGLIYSAVCLVHLLVFPEPSHSGPDKVVYFSSGTTLEEEFSRDRRVVWIIEFFALWSPPCINFASDFRSLAASYTLQNLRFGKLDVTRNPEAAAKYHVNAGTLSKQLPTLLMFRDGKPVLRRPTVDSKSKLIKFHFNRDNVINDFDLNNLYKELKDAPMNKKKDQKQQQAPSNANQQQKTAKAKKDE